MITNLKNKQPGWKRQRGMTLIELMVAGLISVIVTTGMVILMANTLGTGTQTIKMTQLSAEMRTAMQIMTRELRRANYHSTYENCFGDTSCLANGNIDEKIAEININAAGNCFWFWYDRPERCSTPGCQTAILDSGETVNTLAAFRLTTSESADGTVIGSIQMTTGGTTAATACPDSGWVNITNPGVVDIQSLAFNDSVTGFESYTVTAGGTLSVERIGITMSGRLRENDKSLPAFMQNANAPTLAIQDFIRVRNDLVRP